MNGRTLAHRRHSHLHLHSNNVLFHMSALCEWKSSSMLGSTANAHTLADGGA